MTRGQRRRSLALGAVSTVLMAAFWAPAFRHLDATGYGDWQWFHHQWEAGFIALWRFGEVPVFDPSHCGGVPLWGNPQTQVYSPTWLVTGGLFGTTIGHKLYLALHAIVGHAGMYVACRKLWRLSPTASFLAATTWAASGFFAWHGAGGHATFISFYWAPWLLYGWRRSEVDARAAVGVGVIMGLVVAEGGHYPFPYFVLWLFVDLVLRLFARPRAAGRILGGALLSGVYGALLGAYRVVPILLTVMGHPHPVPDDDHLTLSEMLTVLTSRDHPGSWPHHWVWNEYGGFVGWTIVALTGVGVLLAIAGVLRRAGGTPRLGREPFAILVGFALFFSLTQGALTEWHPWPYLQELPFYRSIHVPSRFRVMLTFYMAILAGMAIDALRKSLSRPSTPHAIKGLGDGLAWSLVLCACVDLFVVNVQTNDRWGGAEIQDTAVEGRFHHLRSGARYLDEYADYPWRHVGTRECYDPIPWVIAPGLWLGDEPHARVEPSTAGTVHDADRTTRTIWAEVSAAQPTRVVFDQTYMEGWSSPQGTVTEAENGLVAVDLRAAGDQRVTIRYAPRDLPYSVSVTLVGLALAAIPFALRRRARRRA